MLDEEQEDPPDDPEKLVAAKNQLKARCRKAGIDIEESTSLGPETYLRVGIPNGRNKRPLTLFSLRSIEDLLAIPFEEYCFLGNYEAICSYNGKSIEALARSASGTASYALRRRLFETLGQDPSESDAATLSISRSGDNPISISIGPRTHEIRQLSRRAGASGSAIAIRISNVDVNQHDQALATLEKISNALFFQLDLVADASLSLLKMRPRSLVRRPSRDANRIELAFPEREYDAAPISLYWYARDAFGMPLLQFLAYYQVMEFYFPTFSQAEAKRRAQIILRDPAFRVDRDADVGRLLAAMNLKGRGFGDERSQLRAVINSCIDEAELRAFLETTEDRRDFFSTKQKGLTDRRLPLANRDVDIRNDVSDLIYEIRCRVVHTKGDGAGEELELLLPYSKEAEQMDPYVDLLKMIASRVLVATSSPISL